MRTYKKERWRDGGEPGPALLAADLSISSDYFYLGRKTVDAEERRAPRAGEVGLFSPRLILLFYLTPWEVKKIYIIV